MEIINETNCKEKLGRSLGEIKEAIVFDNARRNITFRLVNAEFNKESLATRPHRAFLDMEIIYVVEIGKNQDGIMSAQITNDILDNWGVTEQELYQVALLNTRQIHGTTVCPLSDVVRNMMLEEGVPEYMIDEMLGDGPEMYVVSNLDKINGATEMIYKDAFIDIANQLESDLYILPSSIHEVIVVPAMGEPEDFADMVKEVNQNEVSPRERLSDKVYRYNRLSHEIVIAAE